MFNKYFVGAKKTTTSEDWDCDVVCKKTRELSEVNDGLQNGKKTKKWRNAETESVKFVFS